MPTDGYILPSDLVTPIMNNWQSLQTSDMSYVMMTGNTDPKMAGIILQSGSGTPPSFSQWALIPFEFWTNHISDGGWSA